jgi:hypothetical protein
VGWRGSGNGNGRRQQPGRRCSDRRGEAGDLKSSAFDLADLNKLYPLCGRERAALYHRHLIAAMREFGITTYYRACHFLAQIGWETGQLRYMRELDNAAGVSTAAWSAAQGPHRLGE